MSGLSSDEWQAPSRCATWSAADVAAHVVGQLTDVVSFRLDGLGSPEATNRQVEERRGRAPKELAEELESSVAIASTLAPSFDDQSWNAPPPGSTVSTLGFGLESLWFDTYIHADDIRAAVGQKSVPGDGSLPSLSHISQVLSDQGYEPSELALDDVRPFEADPVSATADGVVGPALAKAFRRVDVVART